MSIPNAETKRDVLRRCLAEANGDVEAGLAAAEYLLTVYPALVDAVLPAASNVALATNPLPAPKEEAQPAALAHDIHNRRAQGILNATLKAANGLTRDARAALGRVLRKSPAERAAAVAEFVDEYRLQLARLLTSTQLATLLEGMREVASMVPPLALFPGAVPPPPSLDPREAAKMVEGLAAMTAEERAEAIYALPAEQQVYVQQALAARDAGPTDPPSVLGVADLDEDDVHLDIIDEAVRELSSKNVLTRPMYDQLGAAARAKAFTVAGAASEETLTKVRDALARNTAQGADFAAFRRAVLKDVGAGTFLSDAHMETVFRTNIQSAFSDGQMAVLQQPAVRAGFPYAAYDAIHDDRVREEHLALEEHGIGGSNVYRADDPVFKLFRPPWDYNDRCSWTPMTVRQAAEMGVEEARKWLESGSEPQPPAFVSMPPFQPPAGFQRSLAAEPMALRLSLQPMSFAHEGPRDSLEKNARADLIADILVILFGDSAEDEVRGLLSGGALSIDAALASRSGWRSGRNIPAGARYGRTAPGPGWTRTTTARGATLWLPPGAGAAAAPPVAAPPPAPAPAAPPPAPPPPPAAPPPPPAPPAPAPTGGTSYAARLAAATAALNAAMAKAVAGQTLAQTLTPTDKSALAAHLSVMTMPQLRSLHAMLGGIGSLTGTRSVASRTVRALLTGTAPAASTSAPAAAAAPSVLHRGSNVITGKPAAAVVPPAPTSHLGPNDYVPPPPRLVKVSKYGGNAGASGLPSVIDHNTISGYSNNPLQLSKDFTKGTGGWGVAAQYSHSPSGYKVVASWTYGAPPRAGAGAPYEIHVFDDKGTIVSTYKTYASRDPAYVEARTVQVAAWLEKQLPKLTAKPATTSDQLAQFAWDYANQGGTSARGAPFGISGDPADRPKMEGYLRAEFPKLIGAKQNGPHGGMDTVEHTMNIVHPDNLRTAGLPQRDAELLRLGMLYHDVGKQHDPRDPEHPRKSAEDVKDLLWQFGLTEREYADTMVVIKHHDAYGFAMQGKKGMSGPADVAKLAYEYTDDKLPPAQRATEAKRISDLLMRAWQSDVATIPGLTSKPVPGRPDITVNGFLDVDAEGPKFAARVSAEIDKMQGGALPKGFKPPAKPSSALAGTPRPNLVPKGLKWGEIVQRADHTHGGELPVGPQVPYDSTKVPPKEVYDEAKQHPELNYARAFDMGYDGPTGLIIKAYHGQDPNNGKAQNKITAGLIVDTGMRPGSNGDNVFGHGIYTFVNGADRMTANYASDSIIQMEVHTGRMVDHDHLVNHIIPQWRRANPNGAANLPRGVNAEKTAAALWAGYSTISLGYYGGEPAVVVLDPSRVRINKIVGDRSGGYKGMDVKATRGNVNTGGLTSEEKKTKKGNEGYLDTKSNGAPIGWDGKARIN